MRQPHTQPHFQTPLSNGFSTRLLRTERLAVIRLAGEIGFEHGELFEAALLSQAQSINTDAMLDLAELRFINVIGLSVIVRLSNTLRDRGHRLALTNAAPNVCRLLRTVRLHELFPPLEVQDNSDAAQPKKQLAICA